MDYFTFAIGMGWLLGIGLVLVIIVFGAANSAERIGIWCLSAAKCLRRWQRDREIRQAQMLAEVVE